MTDVTNTILDDISDGDNTFIVQIAGMVSLTPEQIDQLRTSPDFRTRIEWGLRESLRETVNDESIPLQGRWGRIPVDELEQPTED